MKIPVMVSTALGGLVAVSIAGAPRAFAETYKWTDDKGVVHAKPITIAAELPHIYAVASGLDEHDKILVEGLRKVREGGEIGVDFKPPADVLGHLEVPAE